jgi:hypothetical protein
LKRLFVSGVYMSRWSRKGYLLFNTILTAWQTLQQISVCANVNGLKKSIICRKRVKEVNNAWQIKQRIFEGTTEKFLISISTATIKLSTQTKDKDGFKMIQLCSLCVFFQVNCTFLFLYTST